MSSEKGIQPDQMKVHEWYVIVYRRYGGRVYDQMRAQFLGKNRIGEWDFNLRPIAGTTSLMTDQFILIRSSMKPGQAELKRGSMEGNARIEAKLGLDR